MANGTIKQMLSDAEIVTITGTSGTGSSGGVVLASKASYPYKCLIPFGLTTNIAYSIELYSETDANWLFGVRDATTNTWASGVTVTFKAFAIK